MGIQYVHLDSRNRMPDQATSRMHVNLSAPIPKCVSMEVSSFSVANEFYNCVDGNNDLVIITQNNQQTALLISVYTVTPGFFTIDEIIADIQEQIDAEGGVLNQDPATRLVISHDSITDKVVFSFNGSNRYRAAIYSPNTDNFFNSVAHRLGFSRQQVIDYHKGPLFSVVDGQASAVSTQLGSVGSFIPENLVSWDFAIVASATNNKLIASHLGFETYSHLFICSNLTDNFQTNIRSDRNSSTMSTSILDKINISVNRASWIHYSSPNSGALVHSLGGRTINSFWVSLNDSQNHEFGADHYKDYSLTLKFTTKDDKEEINEASVQALHDMMFKLKYNC